MNIPLFMCHPSKGTQSTGSYKTQVTFRGKGEQKETKNMYCSGQKNKQTNKRNKQTKKQNFLF